MATRKNAKKENKVKNVKCQPVGNNVCSICGTHFEEDVCDSGHQIGHTYTVPLTKK